MLARPDLLAHRAMWVRPARKVFRAFKANKAFKVPPDQPERKVMSAQPAPLVHKASKGMLVLLARKVRRAFKVCKVLLAQLVRQAHKATKVLLAPPARPALKAT